MEGGGGHHLGGCHTIHAKGQELELSISRMARVPWQRDGPSGKILRGGEIVLSRGTVNPWPYLVISLQAGNNRLYGTIRNCYARGGWQSQGQRENNLHTRGKKNQVFKRV